MTPQIGAWIATLCFHLFYSQNFNQVASITHEKITKILVAPLEKNIESYLGFLKKLQDTDGWILLVDIMAQLDVAISRLQESRRKKRIDLHWLLDMLQKQCDSCIITGTYTLIDCYHNTIADIKKTAQPTSHSSESTYCVGDDLEQVEACIAQMIRDIEQLASQKQTGDLDNAAYPISLSALNNNEIAALLTHQIDYINQCIENIQAITPINTLHYTVIEDVFERIKNIFVLLSFDPGTHRIEEYKTLCNSLFETSGFDQTLKDNILAVLSLIIPLLDALKKGTAFDLYLAQIEKEQKLLTQSVHTSNTLPTPPQKIPPTKPGSDLCAPLSLTQSFSLGNDVVLKQVFFEEVAHSIENMGQWMIQWQQCIDRVEAIVALQRELHTIKGGARMVGFHAISHWAHHVESLLDLCYSNISKIEKSHITTINNALSELANIVYRTQSGESFPSPEEYTLYFSEKKPVMIEASTDLQRESNTQRYAIPLRQTMRLSKESLDELLILASEIVINQERFGEYIQAQTTAHTQDQNPKELLKWYQQQKQDIQALYHQLMSLRLIPIQAMIGRIERLVSILAQDLNKSVHFVVARAEGEIDRLVLEKILPGFEHLIRNAVIHGIESPEVRLQKGKPAQGLLEFALYREKDHMIFQIRDDGAGLQREKIAQKAIAQELYPPHTVFNDTLLLDCITRMGFSTADVLTEHAGRGYGLNVLRETITQMNGLLQCQSSPDNGTVFTVRIPYTLSERSIVFVRVHTHIYGIIADVIDQIQPVNDNSVEYTPASERVDLAALLGFCDAPQAPDHPDHPDHMDTKNNIHHQTLMSLSQGNIRFNITVDSVIETRTLLIKPLNESLSKMKEFLGAVIYQEGHVVLILDVFELYHQYRFQKKIPLFNPTAPTQPSGSGAVSQPCILLIDDSHTIRTAIFEYLTAQHFHVILAENGLDGLEKLQKIRPQLILLDLTMPKMNGIEFLKTIRGRAEFKKLPVIMVTSRQEVAFQELAMSLDVEAYLPKPYDKPKLLNAILRILEQESR
jgi:chemotaxis protein histidine kinase CheA/ActR/RegA family two-component response regulator